MDASISHSSRFLFHVLTLVAMALAPPLCQALIDYPGRLDDGFGTLNGDSTFARTRLNSSGALLQSVAVQPDGRIIVAGRCNNSGSPPFDFRLCAGRFSPAGIADTSFGVNGVYRLDEAGITSASDARIAMLPDGSMYIAGTCGDAPSQRPCIVRLTANGAKDASFGTGGFVHATTAFNGEVKALLVRKNGKLVVLGECALAICAAQFSANGVLETSFRTTWGETAGFVTFLPRAIVEETDNRLALAGVCLPASGGVRGCSVRYYAFEGSGVGDPLSIPNVWSDGDSSEAQSIALHGDGAWLIGGNCTVGGVRRYCVRRQLPNGALDTSFGAAGIARIQFSALDHFLSGIRVQADGKIWLAGICRTPNFSDYVYCVARAHQDGRLDTSFGGTREGREVIPLDQFTVGIGATFLQQDGQLLIGGGGAEMKLFRLRGGWFGARQCTLDIDGDGISGSATDWLLVTRATLGFRDTALTQGVSLAPHAQRNNWRGIRDYLVNQCSMMLVP